MSIEIETPTLGFSGFMFDFETPTELNEAINAGDKPEITNIDAHFTSVKDYGATMTVKAGDVSVNIELNAPSYLWFVILTEFGIEGEDDIRAVDYNEGILALPDNETYLD